MRRGHIAVGIKYALMLLEAGYESALLTHRGRTMTPARSRRALEGMWSRGLVVVPPCDNTRADGTCAGHEVVVD